MYNSELNLLLKIITRGRWEERTGKSGARKEGGKHKYSVIWGFIPQVAIHPNEHSEHRIGEGEREGQYNSCATAWAIFKVCLKMRCLSNLIYYSPYVPGF